MNAEDKMTRALGGCVVIVIILIAIAFVSLR